MVDSHLKHKIFHNADQEIVEYDGSELTWRVSAYAVIIQNNQLLIAKNKFESLHDLPGGGVEFGETIEQALHREAMEEAGAKIKVGKLLKIAEDFFYHSGTKKFHQTIQLFYDAELTETITQPTEADIVWVGFVELATIGTEYRLPTAVEKIVKKIVKKNN